MRLPLFTQIGLSAGGNSRNHPSRQIFDPGAGVNPSACTYGPCIGGRMQVQCCGFTGCTTTYQSCSEAPTLDVGFLLQGT